VGKDGKVVAFFPSKVAPDAAELREAIEKALK
jgi:glutathione peroxidase-family protein